MPAATHTISFSDDACRRLERLAAREGVTPDVAAERAIERVLAQADAETSAEASTAGGDGHAAVQDVPPEAATAFDLVADLLGTLDGPPDLSTNKAYLEAFGERAHRSGTKSA